VEDLRWRKFKDADFEDGRDDEGGVKTEED
jgi:hypothetical protein